MGDQDESWMEDAAAEQEQEGGENERQTKTRVADEAPTAEKTEAQLLIEAKLRKHEEEDAERIREIEEQRRIEREKQEEELRRLKEKQAQRQKQREEEERLLEEQKQQQEEQRKREEEARKTKAEEDKRRKQEEAERKKAAAQAAMSGGRNFVIDKQNNSGSSTIDKFMNISKAKTEMSLNANELEALKKKTVTDRLKPLAVEDLDHAGLKNYAEELWKQIIQLETAKYDLSERFTRQEYDIKELNERQRQTNMKKYAAAGADAAEGGAAGGAGGGGRHPPKVQLISKYERRTDRRTFGERKSLFEWDASREPHKETQKPSAKKRETWIREKGAEEERRNYSYDDEEEEPQDNDHQPAKRASYAAPAEEAAADEEVAVEE